MTTTDARVVAYLRRLEAASTSLPPGRRAELVDQIGDHITTRLAQLGDSGTGEDPVDLTLARLGEPEEIVAAAEDEPRAREPELVDQRQPRRGPSWIEPAALVLLLLGGFVVGVGWIAPPTAGLNFDEGVERRALRAAVADLGSKYGQGYFLGQARSGGNTDELWTEAGKLGFLGVNLPEEYGGGGGGLGELALVLEELGAAGCPLLMMIVSPAICGTILTRFGTDEQKIRWLPGLADGSITMAFAITEPDAGSNSHNITTVARRADSDAADGPEDQLTVMAKTAGSGTGEKPGRGSALPGRPVRELGGF